MLPTGRSSKHSGPTAGHVGGGGKSAMSLGGAEERSPAGWLSVLWVGRIVARTPFWSCLASGLDPDSTAHQLCDPKLLFDP